MQSVSSRIWTRVTVSISYDDNHYTTGTSFFVSEYDNSLLLLLVSKRNSIQTLAAGEMYYGFIFLRAKQRKIIHDGLTYF